MKLHLRGIKTSFTIDEITNGGIFDNHFRPERISGKAEKIGTTIGGDFNNNIGPAGENVFSFLDFFVGKSFLDNLI